MTMSLKLYLQSVFIIRFDLTEMDEWMDGWEENGQVIIYLLMNYLVMENRTILKQGKFKGF